MWMLYENCTGRAEFSWRDLGGQCLVTLFYPLFVIGVSIVTAYRNITGNDNEDYEEGTRMTKQIKLMEVIGE